MCSQSDLITDKAGGNMTLRKAAVICSVIFFSLVTHIQAEIVNFEAGLSTMPNTNGLFKETRGVHIESSGILLGLSVPLPVPYFNTHIRMQRGIHKSYQKDYLSRGSVYKEMDVDYNSKYDAIELLMGRPFMLFEKIKTLPQLGIGYSMEQCGNEADGYFKENYWFVSGSLLYKVPIGAVSAGLRVHLQVGAIDVDYVDWEYTFKVQTGLVFGF